MNTAAKLISPFARLKERRLSSVEIVRNTAERWSVRASRTKSDPKSITIGINQLFRKARISTILINNPKNLRQYIEKYDKM
jgi:hypothetical protein